METLLRDAFTGYRLDVTAADIMRRARRQKRARVGARTFAVASILVLALTGSLLSLSSRSPAYGWTASPGPVDTTLIRQIVASCSPSLPPRVAGDELTPLIVDRRGRAAVGLFERDRRASMCVVVGQDDGFANLDAVVVGRGGRSPDKHAQGLTMTALGARDGRFTVVFGDATPALSAIEIVRDDQVIVHATVKDGHYLAWWPRIVGVGLVRGTDGHGRSYELSGEGTSPRKP